MDIREATIQDIPSIIELLEQVLTVHSDIRPDIFVPGTTKYTPSQLEEILKDNKRPIYVADDENTILGYIFCIIKEQEKSDNLVQFKSIYIDDLCVDSRCREKGIGRALFEFVKSKAKDLGCYEITLNVWEGNVVAQNFYKSLGLKPQKTFMEFIL